MDNEQLNLYVELISKSLKAKAVKNFTQKHHFIPVSSYACEKAELKWLANTDENNFTINLTFSNIFQLTSFYCVAVNLSKCFQIMQELLTLCIEPYKKQYKMG